MTLKAEKLTAEILDELNYHLVGLLDTIDALYTKYNVFLCENGYGAKHKKIPNDTIVEINNCSLLEILKLQKNLM